MQCLIAILMYLGIITSSTGYSDTDIRALAKENQDALTTYRASFYNRQTTEFSTTLTIKKTVWDHEQL